MYDGGEVACQELQPVCGAVHAPPIPQGSSLHRALVRPLTASFQPQHTQLVACIWCGLPCAADALEHATAGDQHVEVTQYVRGMQLAARMGRGRRPCEQGGRRGRRQGQQQHALGGSQANAWWAESKQDTEPG